MNENLTWVWLVAGLIPYRIERKRPSRRECVVTIRALFWTLDVHARRIGRTRCTEWMLHIPLIERIRDAVWAAVTRLKDGEKPG